jgi:hypothetical protein
MAETSTSWECGPGREPGLSRQGVVQSHSCSGNGKYGRKAPMAGRSQIRIPRLNLFAPLRRLSAGSPLEAIWETRLLFCIAGVIVGISGSSSSALGEVEVPASQDVSISDYDQDNNSLREAIANLLDNAYGNKSRILHSNHSPFDAIYNDSELLHYNTNMTTGRSDPFGSPENLGGVIVPAAVWSLAVSTGVHLDHIPTDPGFDLGTVVGSGGRTPDLWTRLTLGFWADNSTDRLSSPLQFQVASCGGALPEAPDLSLCGIADIAGQSAGGPKETKQANGSGATIAPNNTSVAENESNPPSAPNVSPPGPVLDLSPLMPVSVDPLFVSSLLSPCVDTFASCTTAQINEPPAPIDSPGPFPPPDIDDPPLGPIFPPAPASPIPETSTEVMTMIGFGIVFLASRGKTKNSIKHSLAGAFSKITKKSLH